MSETGVTWHGHSFWANTGTELTPEEFRCLLEHFELTIDEYSWLVGYDRKTITSWGKQRNARGIQHFPRWVALLFDAWELAGGPPRAHPWDDITECELRVTPGLRP